MTVYSPHRIICPPGRHLSLSQHTKVLHSLSHNPLPPHFPCLFHALQIPNAKPLPLSKYLLTLYSAASDPPFTVTTAHGASPLPRILSLYRKPQVLDSTPSNPPLLPAYCQYTPPVSVLPPLYLHSPLPRFSRSRPTTVLYI